MLKEVAERYRKLIETISSESYENNDSLLRESSNLFSDSVESFRFCNFDEKSKRPKSISIFGKEDFIFHISTFYAKNKITLGSIRGPLFNVDEFAISWTVDIFEESSKTSVPLSEIVVLTVDSGRIVREIVYGIDHH